MILPRRELAREARFCCGPASTLFPPHVVFRPLPCGAVMLLCAHSRS